MALSRTAYTQHADTDGGANTTTGSYTFPNGELVIVTAAWVNNGADAAQVLSIDDTGADLTWTEIATQNGEAGDFKPGFAAWWAIGNGVACTLTISKTGTVAGKWVIRPYSYTGANNSAPIGATHAAVSNVSDGAYSGSLNASPASDSEVLAMLAGALNDGTAMTVTPGTGWTEINDDQQVDWMVSQIQSRTGSTSTSVGWDDIAVPASTNGYYRDPAILAFEIKAASGNVTLTVDTAGAITVAGQTLNFARSVAVSPGAISIAGSVVTLNAGSGATLVVDAGAISIAGQSIAMNRLAALSEGTLTLAGQNLALNLTTALSPGAITLSGQDHWFEYAVPWDPGLITIAGQALTARLTSALEAGAISIAGQDVVLSASGTTTLPVTGGVITLAGQPLVLQISVPVTPGSLSVTGQSIGFSHNALIEPGAITLTGQTVTLSLTGALDVRMSFDWQGFDRTHFDIQLEN